MSDHLCITCCFLLSFVSFSLLLPSLIQLSLSRLMSFIAFPFPVFSPIPLGAGWFCECSAAGWGKPTTDTPPKRCSLLETSIPRHSTCVLQHLCLMKLLIKIVQSQHSTISPAIWSNQPIFLYSWSHNIKPLVKWRYQLLEVESLHKFS